MNPLILTLSFLSLMSILTTTAFKRFVDDSFQNSIHKSYCLANQEMQISREKGLLNETKGHKESKPDSDETVNFEIEKIKGNEEKKGNSTPKEKTFKRSPVLGINKERPPNNSRLNLYLVLHERNSKPTKGISHYEYAAKLLRHLYGNEEFFQKIPQIEYKLLNALIEKKDKTSTFQFPDDLASLDLEDVQLQEAFYKLLKGGRNFPSLLHYVTFDKESPGYEHLTPNGKKINLFFTSEVLLEVFFERPEIVRDVVSARQAIWNEIILQEIRRKQDPQAEGYKNRSDFKKMLQDTLAAVLNRYSIDEKDYQTLFDFSLGSPGNIIFIVDPISKVTIREKFLSKTHISNKK